MKQCSLGLSLIISTAVIQLYQVQGGIITNQQESLALPSEIADAQTVAPPSSDSKNGTRTGRVVYTAPYSNVRVSSKEPKSLKYFPIPIASKKQPSRQAVASAAPVLITSTTSTTTSTSTPPPPPPSTSTQAVQQTLPDVVEIIEETEPTRDELVTEEIDLGVTEQNERL